MKRDLMFSASGIADGAFPTHQCTIAGDSFPPQCEVCSPFPLARALSFLLPSGLAQTQVGIR